MTLAAKRLGRPSLNESRDALTSVTFKADKATLAAIDALVAQLPQSVARLHRKAGRRSEAIRGALLDAAAKQGRQGGTP